MMRHKQEWMFIPFELCPYDFCKKILYAHNSITVTYIFMKLYMSV